MLLSQGLSPEPLEVPLLPSPGPGNPCAWPLLLPDYASASEGTVQSQPRVSERAQRQRPLTWSLRPAQ